VCRGGGEHEEHVSFEAWGSGVGTMATDAYSVGEVRPSFLPLSLSLLSTTVSFAFFPRLPAHLFSRTLFMCAWGSRVL
jgi:hypothetical protein